MAGSWHPPEHVLAGLDRCGTRVATTLKISNDALVHPLLGATRVVHVGQFALLQELLVHARTQEVYATRAAEAVNGVEGAGIP